MDDSDRTMKVRHAVEAFQKGEMVLVMDRLDRENECDLVLAGNACTPEKMAFMIRHSTGIVCVVSDQNRLESVGLYPAAPRGNTDKNQTNFYVSTDYLPTTTTGVSASDRCETVLALCDDTKLKPADFSKPGHMFPLCARPNGLRDRDGHTESAYDLCRLAGVVPVSIIAEMMHPDGTMMRLDDCIEFAKQHNLPLITVPELKEYALSHLPLRPLSIRTMSESGVEIASSCKIKIDGIPDLCTLNVFQHRIKGESAVETEVVALVRGDIRNQTDVPVRIHSECFTGDILGSLRCDCGPQLHDFVREVMARSPNSCLLYVRGHEGRGIGLANKIKCYHLQDEEQLDTVDANLRLGFDDDLRTFEDCRDALYLLGVKSVALYTNNPEKAVGLGDSLVSHIVPLPSVPNGVNDKYLFTKQNRMKHKTVIDTMKWNELLQSPSAGAQVSKSRDLNVVVVSAIWNDEYVAEMVQACLDELKRNTVSVQTVRVPGALDLIAGVQAAVKKHKDTDAVIAIGVLIQGDTDLYQHSCGALMNGLSQLNTKDDYPPVISGVVMYKSELQASKRLESAEASKLGISWAKSAISMAGLRN